MAARRSWVCLLFVSRRVGRLSAMRPEAYEFPYLVVLASSFSPSWIPAQQGLRLSHQDVAKFLCKTHPRTHLKDRRSILSPGISLYLQLATLLSIIQRRTTKTTTITQGIYTRNTLLQNGHFASPLSGVRSRGPCRRYAPIWQSTLPCPGKRCSVVPVH